MAARPLILKPFNWAPMLNCFVCRNHVSKITNLKKVFYSFWWDFSGFFLGKWHQADTDNCILWFDAWNVTDVNMTREPFWAYPNPFPLEASEQIISGFPMLFGCSSKYFETERFSLNHSLTLSLASRNCVMELHSSLKKDFAVLWRILTWLKYFLT